MTKERGATCAQRFLREWLGLGAAAALLLAMAGHHLLVAREALFGAELNRLQAHARIVADNLVRQLRSVQSAMDGLRADASLPADERWRAMYPQRLRTLADAMPGVRSITVVDAESVVIASGTLALLGRSLAQRPFCRPPGPNADPDTVYVSPPWKMPDGSAEVCMGKSVDATQQAEAGAVLFSLEPEYFGMLARSVLYAQDAAVQIVHGTGAVFINEPSSTLRTVATSPMDDGNEVLRHLASGQVQTVHEGRSNLAGGLRLTVLRTAIPPGLQLDHAFVVAVSREQAQIAAPWREEARWFVVLCVLLLVASALVLLLSQRHRRTEARTSRERLAAEAENAKRLEFGLRGADLGLWEMEVPGGRFSCNARELEILGYGAQEIEPTTGFWEGLVHPDDVAVRRAKVQRHLEGAPKASKIEYRMRHKQGHWVWLLSQAMVIEADGNGRARRILGTHLDITRRKEGAQARQEAALRLDAAMKELQQANERLAQLTVTDGLTGVGNRRLFDQKLEAEWARCGRQQQPLALVMVDVDHFKLYNDHYGHHGGDDALRQVAELLAGCVQRTGELVARYGGEEFAMLLPGCDAVQATAAAQRCLERVAQARIEHAASPVSPWLSLSIGVACFVPQQHAEPSALVLAADGALYAAKRAGRARIELTGSCAVAPAMAAPG